MSLVLDRTAADTLIEHAVGHAEHGRDAFLRALEDIPDNKLHWRPAPTSKSALQIAVQAALCNIVVASILRGEQPPFRSADDMFRSLEREIGEATSRYDCLRRFDAAYRDVLSALDALGPSSVAGMMDPGIMPPTPMTYFMFLPGTRMAEHSAQLVYLRSTWGDSVPCYLG